MEELRDCIFRAAPSATALINYGIPAFALVKGGRRDQQVMIAGFRKHVGFYPHPDVINAFSSRLTEYKWAKGSIQFPLDRPIPSELVTDMVRCRLSQLRV